MAGTKTTEEWEEMLKNPDPRVKWAMDIFDQEGEEFTTCSSKFVQVTSACGFPVMVTGIRNLLNRTPLRTNMFYAILTMPACVWAHSKYVDWTVRRMREEDAMLKHYILTNPERFPEPKRVKWIDRIVEFQPVRF